MSLILKDYTQMEYDEKKMCEFFLKKINFISSCARYIHDEPIYTGYIL
jgi:hypothetical protein